MAQTNARQQRLVMIDRLGASLSGCRRGNSRYDDMFDPLREFDQLGRTRRRVSFDPPSFGPCA